MSFQQLNAVIPIFERIEMSHEPCHIIPERGYEKLVIVQQGYLISETETGESIPISHGYACHSGAGTLQVRIPTGRTAD